MMRLTVLLLIALGQAAAQPVFKSGVDLVEVDVVVIDKSGQPVRGLSRNDFQVFEDGKPVELSTFAAIDVPPAPAAAELPAPDHSGSSLGSNDHAEDGRVLLVVLDDYHVSFDAGRMKAARDIARKLVERMGPSDLAAVVSTSGRSSSQADFTGDKARLVAAIDRFFPQSESSATEPGRAAPPGSGGFNFINEIKARWAMDTLSNAARTLALIPHRRKAILLVSQGLPVSVDDIINNQNAAGAAQALRDFIVTAQRSNIAIYAMDPCGLDLDPGCSTASRQNLRGLAEATGGFSVTNTNAPERSVERMIAENGTYYLLSYVSPAPNDGRRHRIRVQTRLPAVEVRARESYVAARKAAPAETRPSIESLITAPIQSRGLAMRLAAVPVPLAAKPGAAIAVGIEVRAQDAVKARRIDFDLVAVDPEGKVRSRQRFQSTFQPMTAAPAGWIRLGSRVDVPQGTYQLRLAAAGGDGTLGSVFTDVTVPDFSDDLVLGGLSLGATTGTTQRLAELLTGLLPLVPLASPAFTSATQVAAQLPVRIRNRGASQLTIRATLQRGDEAARPLDAPAAETNAYAGPQGKVFSVALPANLAAGSYRLAVEATRGRERARREISFSVRN